VANRHNGGYYEGVFKQVGATDGTSKSGTAYERRSVPQDWERVIKQDAKFITVNFGGVLRED
jgi:hypothetical protein